MAAVTTCRPDVTQTFDLDGPRLVALARRCGRVAAVPETPTAPPVLRGRCGWCRNSGRARAWRCSTTCRSPAHVRVHVVGPVGGTGDPGDRCGRGVHRQPCPRPCCRDCPAWSWTRRSSQGCSALRIRSRRDRRGRRGGRALLSIDGVEGVNVSGAGVGRRGHIGAEIKAEVGRGSGGGDLMSEAMDAEFDTVAEWTAQVAVELGRGLPRPRGLSGER